MTRIKLALAALAVAATAVVSAAQAAPRATILVATDGPGFTITLKQGTRAVRLLKPGRYTITVADKSNIHNFHLMGPGLNRVITTIGFVGTKTIVVSLMKGRYTFVCDPHFTSMKGSFAVS